jgi:hypothetical protein
MPPPGAPDGLYGPPAIPTDLLVFLRGTPTRQAAVDLGLAKGTIHRLSHGYWPDDPRKIMRAWSAYKAARGVVASGWFLRRVYPGGVIRHARHQYTAAVLPARVGQLLAVSCAAGGGLLAQTLDLPAERLALYLMRGGS